MGDTEFFRGDAAELLRWCASDVVLQRYRDYLEADLPRCGDASLIRHLRRLQQLLARLQVQGLTDCAAQDRAGCDALLSDIVAVATWQGWQDCPLQADGRHELPLSGGQTGLLGADEASEGAVLICFPEDGRIALCRHRSAGAQADMSEHWRATGGPH